MIDPRILALIEQTQAAPDGGLLGANPMQLVQNDNIPPGAGRGTSMWDMLGAMSSQPTEMNNFYGAASVRPHVITPNDVWLNERKRSMQPSNTNTFGVLK